MNENSELELLRVQRDALLRRVAAKDEEHQKHTASLRRENAELKRENAELKRQLRKLTKTQ